METWLMGIVLIWLGIISWFDLKKQEVPHTAWVLVPLAGAMTYQAVTGDWQLTFLSAMIALVSERQRLGKLTQRKIGPIFSWIPLILVGVFVAGGTNPIGTIAIVAFWLAWELHCWGGADAVASIALVLIWPDSKLILALLAVHALVAGITTVMSLLKERKLRLHHVPGLPLLFFTVLLRSVFFS